jgi:hypothetical protein
MKKLIFLITLSTGFALMLGTAAVAQTASAPVPLASSPQPSPKPAAEPGLLHLPPATDPGSQKAGQLLEQMVGALGGEAYLNLQNMEQNGRGYAFYHGEPTGAGTLFWRFWQSPDKERTELTKQRDVVTLITGAQGYEITYRGTTALEKDKLEDYLRRRSHSLRWVLRQWLGPGTIVLYEGQGVAERKQAEKVSLLNAQDDGVTIAIDSHTHLPLRVSFVWQDPKTRDRTEEAVGYDNYRPIHGIMTPFSVTGYRNGEPSSQQFITETKYNLNLPDSLFQATVTLPTGKSRKR